MDKQLSSKDVETVLSDYVSFTADELDILYDILNFYRHLALLGYANPKYKNEDLAIISAKIAIKKVGGDK